MNEEVYDCLIVGGGPAGLSAALILGRCLRTVAILDSGSPRNCYARTLHAFLTRDVIAPAEFYRIAQEDLRKYETVEYVKTEVVKATKLPDFFMLTDIRGKIWRSRTLLIATGVMDAVPDLPGFMNFYGKSVHNCPYCDAWEVRGKKLAAYGKGNRGFEQALPLLKWSRDLILFTDGTDLTDEQKKILTENNIAFYTEKITQLHGKDGQLESIELENGEQVTRDAMFFNTESFIRSKLLEELNCPFTNEEGVETGKYERTEVPGLFVAGNILREVQLVIVAAAEGAEAAFGINKLLNRLK